ncbi:FecR family protein [Lunatibacter salilacus]|uniref:FecR family protein n=1 Tax=Lunatibacter salilacus TaxID=2483804 RepID=UPI00131EAFFD|nr:FecR domain-containing protein [Lunatibacter salilacus]
MELSSQTTEDFVLDPEFRKWVLSPNNSRNIRWERYLQENPGRRDAILLAKSIVLNLDHSCFDKDGLSEADKVHIWNKIKEGATQSGASKSIGSVVVPISSEAILKKRRTNKGSFLGIWRYAAIILFSLGLGWLWIINIENQDEEVLAVANWQNYETPLGVKSTITLSDGSVATLNSGTKIRYVENFIGSEREVLLEGEAFFEVASDSTKPFVVHAGGLSTRALGTSFNIKAFEDEMTEVALVTGSVEVRDTEGSNVERILPGEGVFSIPGKGNMNRQRVNLDHITAWMQKTIVFDKTPFSKAMLTLEKWYGVQINVVNLKEKDLKITGRYQDETLKNILEGLGYGTSLEYRINGKEVTIKFKE